MAAEKQFENISIHSLRMEGDTAAGTPEPIAGNFNPLPPHGGRRFHDVLLIFRRLFQSTPSAWRETAHIFNIVVNLGISIHSLRMEGDKPCIRFFLTLTHFNPLPPHGGRQTTFSHRHIFQVISIHSLRMEGDLYAVENAINLIPFQSTPSAWRETNFPTIARTNNYISIHSLRMEGDDLDYMKEYKEKWISIHSLRMEGDIQIGKNVTMIGAFQSTPSAWRETAKLHRKAFFISPILVQSCKKGCKRLHSAPEKMVFFEKREKNLVRNLQHLSVRL